MEKPNSNEPLSSNEDEEDTLSLSDLPMYCDQNIEFWVEDRSMRSDVEEDFEFSSEMMIASHDSSSHVIFCGKIIHVSPQNDNKKHLKHRKHPEASVTRNKPILISNKKSIWYLFMFGFGSNKVPKKLHIEELKKRQSSLRMKHSDYSSCGTWDGNRTRSHGFLRFLCCGGGGDGNEINDEETSSKDHSHTWMSFP